jgi:hypothetical protein
MMPGRLSESPPFGRSTRVGLGLLGLAMAAAGVLRGLYVLVVVGVAGGEGAGPHGLEAWSVAADLLAAILLVGAGIFAFFCRDRRRLAVLAVLAAVAAAAFAASRYLEREAMRPNCFERPARLPPNVVDATGCLAGRPS